ncbi:MAG: MFS transporter [Bifidobacteriaceae bacterium]|jgi:inositol transporter-like SP family MFS transporter|nr:MFS transporter [Bifidobacteriaceae bacterium]
MKSNGENGLIARPLTFGAGAGSFLGAAAIVGLSSTITVWQNALGLSTAEVGILSGLLSLAIAIGSLLANVTGRHFGRTNVYRNLLVATAVGFVVCALAANFWMLLIGNLITGITTGIDLPVALSLVSDARYTKGRSAKYVSLTQSGWQLGILVTMVAAFAISWIDGSIGCRLVFVFLAVISAASALYRRICVKFSADDMALENSLGGRSVGASVAGVGDGVGASAARPRRGHGMNFWKDFTPREYAFFFSILVFYVFWNFLGNTWGQFQTFIFVNAHASQSLATGIGILVCLVSFLSTFVISAASGTRFETPVFFIGSAFSMGSLLVLAFTGSQLWWLIGLTFVLNIGTVLAGEATSKVWIQTLFRDAEQRTSVQGFILAVSRVGCSLLALVTPQMVMPDTIQSSMFVFFGFALVSCLAGVNVLRLKKRPEISR